MALHRLVVLVLSLLLLAPLTALAQNPPAPQNQPAPVAASGEQLLKAGELDALVAPIALYPDNLLSLIMMASTYPLEVVMADRWLKENKKLKGDQLKAAVDKQNWDDSVKSLIATPDVLSMMSTKLDWTRKLGDAVLAQQADVMDAIQRLRTKAEANDKLTSTKQQKVTKTQQQGKQLIAIEPTDPDTLYVPYYDPGVVYGAWPYAEYPPYYFGYPGYIAGGLIATGLAFGAGWALGNWGSGGNYWGGGFNWNNNNINIDRPRPNPPGGGLRPTNPIAGGGNRWEHRPEHRQGVRYNNPRVEQRFGNNNRRNSVQNRMDFRGRPGSERPGAGQRPAGGRPSAGQRPSGGRPKAAQRPAGGRGGGNALGNVGSGRGANRASARGRASMGGGGVRAGGGGGRGGGGGGMRGGGGGGRGGGGGGRGGGGGGRRSDITLKHDIVLLGHLDNGLGFYRFSYNGSNRAYVGVMAQEVQTVAPEAVSRGQDGYLRVYYDRLGVKFQTYAHWVASGAQVPVAVPVLH
jgi:hypothetical protein